jgi:hypothetical protein
MDTPVFLTFVDASMQPALRHQCILTFTWPISSLTFHEIAGIRRRSNSATVIMHSRVWGAADCSFVSSSPGILPSNRQSRGHRD